MGNKATSETSQLPSSRGSRAPSAADPELDDATPEQQSYWQMAKQGYQELVNAIIRPPRCIYELKQLGPIEFEFCGKMFQRRDFNVMNPRGMTIVCSMWEPAPQHRQNLVLPCVIYMHGNSSARLEALPQLSIVLGLGITLLSFDFCGSGMSDGEYVSLGAFEKDDLKAVVEFLRSIGTTSTIALWGRSMGAATSLLHGERDPSIAGMVLDSSFADLTMLAEEMVDKGRQNGLFAPSLIVKLAIRFIRSSVLARAGFDIKELSPIEHADKCYIPAMFVAGEDDTFVSPHHSEQIHARYAGDKNLVIVPGDHNSARPRFLFDSVGIFLMQCLQIPETWALPDSARYTGTLPWYSSRGRVKYAPSLEDQKIGMTKERQDDVQNKVQRMLGQSTGSGKASSSSAAAEPSAGVVSIKTKSSSSGYGLSLKPQYSDISLLREPFSPKPSPETSNSNFYEKLSSPSTSGQRCSKSEFDSNKEAGPLNQTVSQPQLLEDWACETCTLVNSHDDVCCAACGISRYDSLYSYSNHD